MGGGGTQFSPPQQQQQFCGFWRAHGPGYIHVVATTWVPGLSPNDNPNPSEGRKKGVQKNRRYRKISSAAKQREQGPVWVWVPLNVYKPVY